MRKEWIPIIIMGIIIIIGLYFLMFVKAPSVQAPALGAGLVVTNIKSNDEISSPVKITGYVNDSGWSGFEGQVGSVELLDGSGKEIASGTMAATTDWTKLPANFEADLNFNAVPDQQGTLVFHNENPSGMPEKDNQFSLPVKIKAKE